MEIVGVVIAAIGILVAVWYARNPHFEARHAASVAEFKSTRAYIRESRKDIVQRALELHEQYVAGLELPVLTLPGWILPEPVPIDRVALERVKEAAPSIERASGKLRRYWPLLASGERLERYSQAVTEYDRPTNWFNGAAYRLLEVASNKNSLSLKFCGCSYWDMFDTTEALLYEAAFIHKRTRGKQINGPYRKHLSDPFDFAQRCAIPGIDALTIRGGEQPVFFLHYREGKDVASAGDVLGIVPAGEFQPSHNSEEAKSTDFSLWLSILRESVEEFLNDENAAKHQGGRIDYLEHPYRDLNQAYKDGDVGVHVLGCGLDPITWKPTIMTACIYEPQTFDRLFAAMAPANREGILESRIRNMTVGVASKGLPFDEEGVRCYASNPRTLPVARAGLILAWNARAKLGIRVEGA
jgi:hypothetical protein